jgi:hypothetical protein
MTNRRAVFAGVLERIEDWESTVNVSKAVSRETV